MSYSHPMNPVSLLHMQVADLLDQYPDCIPVFLRHHMICVGCGLAPFDTVEDAMRNYGLPQEGFLEELRGVVKFLQKE